MKYSDLKKQAEVAQRRVADLRREMEITRSIQMIQLGEVPKHAIVEFRIRQQTDEMSYSMYADRQGFKESLENDAVRSLCREISRQGFISVRSEFSYVDRAQVTEYKILVVRP